MTEKLTRIRLPGSSGANMMNWGERTAQEMIKMVRDSADVMRRELTELDAAKDEDFQIDVVRGVHVQKHLKELQKSTHSEVEELPPTPEARNEK